MSTEKDLHTTRGKCCKVLILNFLGIVSTGRISYKEYEFFYDFIGPE